MIYYIEIDFWDNVIEFDGVCSEYHNFLTVIYMSYYNILSSSHIVLSSKLHGVLVIFKFYIYINHYWIDYLSSSINHKVTYITLTYYECLSNHTCAKYMNCEQKI